MATTIATGHDSNGGFVTYPSTSNAVAYLWDGSLLVLAADEPNMVLYQIASPAGASPTASTVKTFAVSGATSSSGQSGDIFLVDNGNSSNDVWIAVGENNNVGGAIVTHGVYHSDGTWTWDATTSVIANGQGTVNQISIVWTGTYLIAGMRAWVGGQGSFSLNYTTDKSGQSGWLTTLVQLSSITGGSSHYFGTLMHDTTLGATVAVYSINGDTLQSRVLPDTSSPALANWGPETALGTGTLNQDDFQGPSCCLDHTTGRVHVAYHTGAGTGVFNIGYVSGTVTVSGASSAVSWSTPFGVGTQSVGTNANPCVGVDGAGMVWVFWTNHYIGNSAANLYYATIASPYTSASAQTQLTSTTSYSPQIPKRARFTRGYVPLVYTALSTSPYNVMYDNSIVASSGGSTIQGAATLNAQASESTATAVTYAARASASAQATTSGAAGVTYAALCSLSAQANLTGSAIATDGGVVFLAAAATLSVGAGVKRGAKSSLAAQANLATSAALLLVAALSLAAQANLSANSPEANYKVPTATILLQIILTVAEVLDANPTAIIELLSTAEGTVA